MIEIKADAYSGTMEQPLPIGRRGEKLVRTVVFDINGLREIYGDGTWTVVFKRPGIDETPYNVSNKWTSAEGLACWDIDRTDSGTYGYGKVELRYYPTALNQENDELSKIYKSKVWITYTEDSLGEDGSVPSPYSDLLNIIRSARDEVLGLYEQFEDAVTQMMNPDWAETNSSLPTFIRNKPYIPQLPSDVGALSVTLKGSPNGLAELDANGFVKSSQLPSYIDDILEFESDNDFPEEGESGKIYLSTNTNTIYRWSGSSYVAIPVGLSLGTTSETAFRGDYGNIAYNHALSSHFSGSYTDLTNKPTIGNGTITIKKNDGTSVDSFDLNSTNNKDINLPAQTQSDWNTSDTTSPAYILNKPNMSNYTKVRILTAAEYAALSTAEKNSDTLYFIKDSGGAWLAQTVENSTNSVPSSKVLYDIYQTIMPQDLTNKLSFVQTFTPHDWGCKLYKRGGYYWFWLNITWDTQPSGNVITVDDQYITDISGPANSSASLNWNAMSNNGVQIHLFLRNAGIQINGFNSSNFTANDGIREWIVFPDCLPTITS